ncbi:MAG: Zn-ribbon domain-containing OB-fold protein [Desulfobacteraceae bacterium]|nr:Zn-ribbon domain-containing OB-fold protein [Desulfobacteraceae bacterium]
MTQSDEKPHRPEPEVSRAGAPFWEAAGNKKLLLQHCRACNENIFYPRIRCPRCHREELDWIEASGKGVIYSYSVVLNNAPSGFLADMPYVVAIVRLTEGVQMLSNIVDCDPETIHCDMPVEVVFREVGEFTLPLFRPTEQV